MLTDRYGSEASHVLRRGSDPIAPGHRTLRGEVDWGIEVEGARTLVDLVYRRLRLPLYDPGALDASVPWILQRMSTLLGWTRERETAEAAALERRLAADRAFA